MRAILFFEENRGLAGFIAVLGAFGIFIVSSLSFPPSGPGTTGSLLGLVYHFSAFFLLSLFTCLACIRERKASFFLIVFLVLFFYSFLDEVHQLYVAGRFFSFVDVAVNSGGILLALGLYRVRLSFL